MKTLGANAIRVYHVDSGKDHSACMTIFEQAGIYLFVDLDTFDTQINQVSSKSIVLRTKSITNIRHLDTTNVDKRSTIEI